MDILKVEQSGGCGFSTPLRRQVGPEILAQDLCHGEFVLQYLSVTPKLMELFV